MTVLCTYCSAKKDKSDKLLPAISRYQSDRINWIYNESLTMGLPFFIFSGEYGLLHPSTKIPFYDHQLLADEIDKHSDKLKNQIISNKITHLILYGRSIKVDPALKIYYDCMALAIKKANAILDQNITFEFNQFS